MADNGWGLRWGGRALKRMPVGPPLGSHAPAKITFSYGDIW